MRLRKKYFTVDDSGAIRANNPKGWNKHYQKAVEDYLTLWDELFKKAQEKDEFQFILALLRFKGVESAGWDFFDNTIEAVKGSLIAAKKARGDRKLNIMLWTYGHIVEAADHYEIIANMVNVAGGDPYKAWNFPRIRTRRGMRDQTPNEKIIEIKRRCDALGFKDYSAPFYEVLDKELRNAIYHSDYSAHYGMARFRNSSTGLAVEYDTKRTNKILNQSLALHETIKNLSKSYQASYVEPKIIDAGPHFTRGAPMKIQLIVRRVTGVIAMYEVPTHSGSVMLGRFVPGEQEKINRGVFLLPRSSTERVNEILDHLPRPVAKLILKIYNKFNLDIS